MSPSPPAVTAIDARGMSAGARRHSISGHVNPGWLAPHVEAVTDEIAISSASSASAAAATARFRPGNDPENPAAITSPGPMPTAASLPRQHGRPHRVGGRSASPRGSRAS